MAGSFSLSGNDTLIYGTTVLTDLPDGKIFEATWDDTLVEQKVGKNGNVISVFKPLGKKAKVTLRLLRASGNDVLINSDLVNIQADLPSFKTVTLTANKRFGDGNGNIVNDTIVFKGGLIMKIHPCLLMLMVILNKVLYLMKLHLVLLLELYHKG